MHDPTRCGRGPTTPGAGARVAVGRPRVSAAAVLVALALALLSAAPAHATATIYFRGVSTAKTGSGASSLTLTAPAGLSPGDLMVLDMDQVGGSASVPSGWTAIVSNSNDPYGNVTSNVWYRVATSADVGASYLITFSGSVQAVARILDYVGTSSSPFETSSTNYIFGASSSPSFNSISTSSANSLVMYQLWGLASTLSLTGTPAGTSTRVNLVNSGGSGQLLGYDGDLIQASTGSTGSRSASFSTTADWADIVAAFAPAASGQLAFGVAPNLPNMPSVTLNGQSQTVTAQMPSFGVDDTTGGGAGWNVTMQGATGTGLSPVFAQYCPVAACGTIGYVGGGATLPAGSLTLNSTGGTWATTGGTGTTPTMQCSSGCTLDSGTATKIASAASGGGEGPWLVSGFTANSLSLTVPTTVRVLPASEVYRVDLVASLNSGP